MTEHLTLAYGMGNLPYYVGTGSRINIFKYASFAPEETVSEEVK